MDLDSFLVSLYVLVDDWWKLECSSEPPKTGRPALLSNSEVMTLAILAQWPRFRSERDFWRFACSHLRSYFPNLCSQSQFNRRVRALESPRCAPCSGLSPEDSPGLRPSTAFWIPPSCRRWCG